MEEITKEQKRMSSFLTPKYISTFVSNASSYLTSNNKRGKNLMIKNGHNETSSDSIEYNLNENINLKTHNNENFNKKKNITNNIKSRIKTKQIDTGIKNLMKLNL
jgi:hypothetical protein